MNCTILAKHVAPIAPTASVQAEQVMDASSAALQTWPFLFFHHITLALLLLLNVIISARLSPPDRINYKTDYVIIIIIIIICVMRIKRK